jgi:NADH-quinone oxidoreductase subunit N
MTPPANFSIPLRDLAYIAPSLILAVWGLIVLVLDFSLLRKRSSHSRCQILGRSTLAVVAGTILLALASLGDSGLIQDPINSDWSLFSGFLAGDLSTLWFNFILLALLAMTVGLSTAWNFTTHWGEYFALLCWSAVGMMLMVAADELLTLFLCLETMTICLYLATSFEKTRRRSAEGGLKYFVYGSVSSAVFLFGLSLLYGMTGTTRLDAVYRALVSAGAFSGLEGNIIGAVAVVMILVGLGFKIAAVPFHQWAPDVYEGAPAPVAGWIAAGSKLASFVAMVKIMVAALGPWAARSGEFLAPGWVGLIAVIAAVSMTYGNFAALVQNNLKRMLAYSSIAHAGYLLVGVLAASISVSRGAAAGAVLFYLVVYALATMGAFALAAWLARDLNSDQISDLAGLGRRSPALGASIVLLMLSLIGMPPLAGFFGKLLMFMEAINTRETDRLTMIWLVALGLFNSVVSAFYYVRVLKVMYLREPKASQPVLAIPPAGVRWTIGIATALVLLLGIYPNPLVESLRAASIQMLTIGGSTGTGRSSTFTEADPNFKLDPEEVARRNRELGRQLQGISLGGDAPPPKAAPRRKSPPKDQQPGQDSAKTPAPSAEPPPPSSESAPDPAKSPDAAPGGP